MPLERRTSKNSVGSVGSSESLEAPVEERDRYLSVFDQIGVVTTEMILVRRKHPSKSRWLALLVGGTILLNALMIGIEVDTAKSSEDQFIFLIFEVFFLSIFVTEMAIKIHLLRWEYFLDPWNILDYHLVVLGFVDVVVRFMFAGSGEMKVITAFRMLRMLRVVRQIRLLRLFRDLWTIVKGFYDSLSTVFWVTVLLIVVCYAIAVLLVIAVGSNRVYVENWQHTDVYVGSVPRAMLTVFQVITLESWTGSIVRPIIKHNAALVWVFIIVIILLRVVFLTRREF